MLMKFLEFMWQLMDMRRSRLCVGSEIALKYIPEAVIIIIVIICGVFWWRTVTTYS